MHTIFLSTFLAFSLLFPFRFLGGILFPPPSIADIASDSVVIVTAGENSCSGFTIAPQRVMTVFHCVGDAMLVDGNPVIVLKIDPYYDLALLYVGKSTKPSLGFKDKPLKRFDQLTAIGHSWGWSRAAAIKVEVILTDFSPSFKSPPLIVVKGPYVHGMSGGPVVDRTGKVASIIQGSNEQLGFGVGSLIMRAFLLGLDLERLPI